MRVKKVEYVLGVDIDFQKFRNTSVDHLAQSRELGIPEESVLLLSVGELNKNKIMKQLFARLLIWMFTI